MATTLHLDNAMFGPARQLLVEHGDMRVYAYRFTSGVAALDITTGTAQFTLLPYQGQQIWDAWVGERRLTMQSVFDMPIETREFRKSYGAFFVHCGGTAMGSPQPGEHHLPHGELPYIPFERAYLSLGREKDENFVELGGVAHEREAFSHAFTFTPTLRFYERSTIVHGAVCIENIGGDHMPCMYLAHVNFAPVADAHIADGADDTAHSWCKPDLPLTAPPNVGDWHDRVCADFSAHRRVGADDRVEPEFVATLKIPAGPDGWAQSKQIHTDGQADFVSWQPRELPYVVRWISRAPERQAMGFALPATAGPNGREAARQNGDLFYLARGDRFTAQFRFGTRPSEQSSDHMAKTGATLKTEFGH